MADSEGPAPRIDIHPQAIERRDSRPDFAAIGAVMTLAANPHTRPSQIELDVGPLALGVCAGRWSRSLALRIIWADASPSTRAVIETHAANIPERIWREMTS